MVVARTSTARRTRVRFPPAPLTHWPGQRRPGQRSFWAPGRRADRHRPGPRPNRSRGGRRGCPPWGATRRHLRGRGGLRSPPNPNASEGIEGAVDERFLPSIGVQSSEGRRPKSRRQAGSPEAESPDRSGTPMSTFATPAWKPERVEHLSNQTRQLPLEATGGVSRHNQLSGAITAVGLGELPARQRAVIDAALLRRPDRSAGVERPWLGTDQRAKQLRRIGLPCRAWSMPE